MLCDAKSLCSQRKGLVSHLEGVFYIRKWKIKNLLKSNMVINPIIEMIEMNSPSFCFVGWSYDAFFKKSEIKCSNTKLRQTPSRESDRQHSFPHRSKSWLSGAEYCRWSWVWNTEWLRDQADCYHCSLYLQNLNFTFLGMFCLFPHSVRKKSKQRRYNTRICYSPVDDNG